MNWSPLLDPQNRINSGLLKKKLKTLLPSNKKLKLEKGKNDCSQDGNYRKSVFQANLKQLGCNSLINAGMMWSGCLLTYNLFGPWAILSKISQWPSSFQARMLSIQNENVVPHLHLQPKTEGDSNSTCAKLSGVLRTVARQRRLPRFVSLPELCFYQD